ncbi:MAG: LysR substrate-binding domain-containing protein, partial [Burkholderiaceae bacterium]
MQDDMPDIYRMEHLYGGPYVCVMRKGHPLAEKDGLSMDDFCEAHHLLVSYSGRPFGFTDQALASIGRSRRIVLTVNQFFTGGQVVINSDLLTVLPEHFLPVTGFQDQLVVRELPYPMAPATVDALWLQKNDSRPEYRWMVNAIMRSTAQSLANNPAGFSQ